MSKLISFDIGGSAVKWAIVRRNGNIIESGSYPVEVNDIEIFMERMNNVITGLRKKYQVSGIAISSPGSVDSNEQVVYGLSAVPCIHHNQWIKQISITNALPISVENDANCALLAEQWLGNAKGIDNVVSVVVGTGIGGSIMVNEKLVSGSHLYGGEFGYMLVPSKDGLKSISELISTAALVKRVQVVADVDNGWDVFAKAKTNPEIQKVISEYVDDFAMLLYNLQHALDPKLFLIGGAISKQEQLLEMIKVSYKRLTKEVGMSDIEMELKACEFKNDANLIGAVKNWKNMYE